MGLYDREYYRDDDGQGYFARGSRSAVTDIIIANVAIFVLDYFSEGWLSEHFALRTGLFRTPWHAYQLLTYGFLHDLRSIQHILFNMLGLFFFGRDVEAVYGRKRFITLYLSLIVLSGLAWEIAADTMHARAEVVGASGAIMGVLVLFGLHFPNRTIFLNLFIPVPAWLMIVLYVGLDVLGSLNPSDDHVAHGAHLAGAAFAFLFYRTGWTLANLWPDGWSLAKLKRRPSLRVHEELSDEKGDAADDDAERWKAQVDALLEKISRQGEASLTPAERKTLEEASRRYQQRRRS